MQGMHERPRRAGGTCRALPSFPRLFADLAVARGGTGYGRLLRTLARVKLLILDDWRPEALNADQARDLFEIVEDPTTGAPNRRLPFFTTQEPKPC
jgi:DNA replication protein DnaC